MKLTGPLAVPPPESCSFEERIFDTLEPVPEPPLKRRASVAANSMMLSMLSSTRVDKTRAGLLFDVRHADVEPHWRVESAVLMQEQIGQFIAERLRVGIAFEIATFAAPFGDGIGNAANHLTHAGFAARRVKRAAKILADDNVGGKLAPAGAEFRNLFVQKPRGHLRR